MKQEWVYIWETVPGNGVVTETFATRAEAREAMDKNLIADCIRAYPHMDENLKQKLLRKVQLLHTAETWQENNEKHTPPEGGVCFAKWDYRPMSIPRHSPRATSLP